MTFSSSNKPIGGEQEIAADGRFYGVTNSGRSSLRWIIQSMHLQGKRVLVPDFVCQIVVDVLLEYNIAVSFYQVRDDFEFSLPDDITDVDALYLVRYFGHESASFEAAINHSKIPLIIDDVFGVEPPVIAANVPWSYFNSLRKVTAIADFSQLISNVPLAEVRKQNLTVFSTLKYQAKEAKSDFLRAAVGDEQSYLAKFAQAESILDEHVGICSADDKSIYLTGCFYRNLESEISVRRRNLLLAKEYLNGTKFLDINPKFPSFLPLVLHDRDKIRRELMQHSIFLAVHWPATKQSPSGLSEKLLSLPLDSRYSVEDIERICTMIKRLE
jgi:hypothetical protein